MLAGEIQAERRRGGLHLVRPGIYRLAVPANPAAEHLQQVWATAETLRSDAVISHVSAAALHGLPVWGLDLNRVSLTYPGRSGVASSRRIRPHRGAMTDAEIVDIGGLRVTSPARTVLDIARCSGFEPAVVVADAALHSGLVVGQDLRDVLQTARGHGSAGGAIRVINFANGLSESVGESRSRVVIARLGLPVPRLQTEIRDGGRLIARVDFDYDGFLTVGEFDGLRKYYRDLRPGERAEDVVVREKVREDAVRDTGLQMVRWTWADLSQPAAIGRRHLRAFARAGFPDWRPGLPRTVDGLLAPPDPWWSG